MSGDYDISVISNPKNMILGSAHTVLKAFADQFEVSNPGLKVLTSEFIQFKGNPSMRLTTTSSSPSYTGAMSWRLIFVNHKVYAIAGGGNEENWKKVEDSFEILPSK